MSLFSIFNAAAIYCQRVGLLLPGREKLPPPRPTLLTWGGEECKQLRHGEGPPTSSRWEVKGRGEAAQKTDRRQLCPPPSEGAQLSHPASIVAGRPRGRAGCSTWPGQLLSQTAPGRPALIQTGNRQPSSRESLGCREWATAVGGGPLGQTAWALREVWALHSFPGGSPAGLHGSEPSPGAFGRRNILSS